MQECAVCVVPALSVVMEKYSGWAAANCLKVPAASVIAASACLCRPRLTSAAD
jgi:hypothetical protein